MPDRSAAGRAHARPPGCAPGRRAVVVFDGAAYAVPYRLLRPGFRHCWVALDEAGNWTVLEARASALDVRTLAASDYDIAGFYRRRGFAVRETCASPVGKAARAVGFPLMTCVEVVKRVLGIDRAGVITPWQLYRYLENRDE